MCNLTLISYNLYYYYYYFTNWWNHLLQCLRHTVPLLHHCHSLQNDELLARTFSISCLKQKLSMKVLKSPSPHTQGVQGCVTPAAEQNHMKTIRRTATPDTDYVFTVTSQILEVVCSTNYLRHSNQPTKHPIHSLQTLFAWV